VDTVRQPYLRQMLLPDTIFESNYQRGSKLKFRE
jgi:hypothetical protein